MAVVLELQAELAASERPLPLVIMSSYRLHELEHLRGEIPFLSKPFALKRNHLGSRRELEHSSGSLQLCPS